MTINESNKAYSKSLKRALPLLICPKTKEKLKLENGSLVSKNTNYKITNDSIPRFLESSRNKDAIIQERHYDSVADKYIENLSYPHTIEYLGYLDNKLDKIVNKTEIGVAAEICCGAGEAFKLYESKIDFGVGVDVSVNMLTNARATFNTDKIFFTQGDATCLPLADDSFDTVFCLGGIHHVNDRKSFFNEVNRILKPNGRFIWREPVSDLLLWKILRTIIYKISPSLDYDTESPLQYNDTVPVLKEAGMELESWKTYGFLGFCVFMNSDVLVFNRFFKYIPGIRYITKLFIFLDELCAKMPLLQRKGLQVIGSAIKR